MNYSLNILLIYLLWCYSKGCHLDEYKDGNICKPCHSTCKKCNGPSEGHCTKCNISYTLCREDRGNFCKTYSDCYRTTTRTTPLTTLYITTSTKEPTLAITMQTNVLTTENLKAANLSLYIVVAILCIFFVVIGFLIRQFICTRYKCSVIKRKEIFGYSKTVVEVENLLFGEANNGTTEKTKVIIEEGNTTCNNSKRKTDQSMVAIGEFTIENFANDKLDWEKRICISSGAFGVVYKCPYRDSEGSYYVAVKEPKAESREAFREREYMSQVKDHPHVIQLINTMLGDNMLLVMPLRKSNLSDFLEKNKGITITDKIRYGQQIAHGMSYLMFKRILHCDLKASNVLVVDKNFVQITDFGKSQKRGTKKRIVGTITHTALELFCSQVPNSEATDVWSFGVTIWEIFNVTKHLPYADVLGNNAGELRLINYLNSKEHLKTTFWPSTSDSPTLEEIATCMFKCWCHIQTDRPTFNYLWGFFSSKLPECNNAQLFNLSDISSTNSKSLPGETQKRMAHTKNRFG